MARSNQPTDAERAHWDRVLAAEGLPELERPQAPWTFAGGDTSDDGPAAGPCKHYVPDADGNLQLVETIQSKPRTKRTRIVVEQLPHTFGTGGNPVSESEAIDGLTLSTVEAGGVGSVSDLLANHPKAVYWRRAAQAAHDLPKNYPRRAFIVETAESGYLDRAAREHKISRSVARKTWHQFLFRSELPTHDSARFKVRG